MKSEIKQSLNRVKSGKGLLCLILQSISVGILEIIVILDNEVIMRPEDKIHIRPSKELQEKFKEQGERYDVFLDVSSSRDKTVKYVWDNGVLVEIEDL
jgi:hypothetical protein